MYLRHSVRRKDGKPHVYWRLVRSVRRNGKVVQETVAQLGELFDLSYDLLLYDVTSTYFEGLAERNELAQRGHSRDHRPDCKQVCIALVVTREGMPLGYEVFSGNRVDLTTVEEIVAAMESRYGIANRVWVMDRGMSSADNVAWLQETGRRYWIGAPKGELKKWSREIADAKDWRAVREGVGNNQAAVDFLEAALEAGTLTAPWLSDTIIEGIKYDPRSIPKNGNSFVGGAVRRSLSNNSPIVVFFEGAASIESSVEVLAHEIVHFNNLQRQNGESVAIRNINGGDNSEASIGRFRCCRNRHKDGFYDGNARALQASDGVGKAR